MNPTLRLGFMGFGEAALLFANDLSRTGAVRMAAYSPSSAKAQPGDALHARAQSAGVQLVRTPGALARQSDVIFALTQGKNAVAAARKILRSLKPHHLYVDGSAGSAKAMEKIAALIGPRAKFVDAAIMGPVTVSGIRIPIVASGLHAGEFREALTPCGMNIKVISDKPGAASAMKLIRSVCMKGLTAMLYESLEAAHRRGILDACIEDFSATFNDMPFEKILKRFVCSMPAHAERRKHELKESLDLLHAAGSRDRMTRAISGFMTEMARTDLPRRFPHEADSVQEIMDAWIESKNIV